MKWSYLSLEIDPNKDATNILNEKGAQGWELVAVTTKYSSGGYLESYKFFLKKQYFARPTCRPNVKIKEK